MSYNYNLETYYAIWLDPTINELSRDNIAIKQRLRTIINYVVVFNSIDECQKYIKKIPSYDRVVLIINGHISQSIILHLKSLRQIYSIYIYNLKPSEQITFDSNKKINACCAEADEIIKKIEKDYYYRSGRYHRETENFISISTSNENSACDQSSTGINGQFIFSQLLVDNLLRMRSEQNDKDELIAVCEKEYDGNTANILLLEEFKQTYSPRQAILWYTKESFLYRLLNKSLRTQNIDLLFLFRFFIRDIHEQLKQCQYTSPITVYRGQIMSVEEFNLLENSVGQLIAMNSFLSTTIQREVALFYLGDSICADNLIRVLFEIFLDPQVEGVRPFANITNQSYFPDEEEILIMLGSVFRLESIVQARDETHKLNYTIRMTLHSSSGHALNTIYESIKSEIITGSIEKTSLLEFGNLLNEMGKFNEAERYFHRLLNQLPVNHPDRAHCYHGIGEAISERGDYESSLQWLYKALHTRTKILPSNHEDIGCSYNSIGITYRKNSNYELALESYEKAMFVWSTIYNESHPRVAWCLNNIGVVYQNQKLFTKSLDYVQKALVIAEKVRPPDHPDIATVQHNIGDAYYFLGKYAAALEFYEKALNIFEKSRPNHHPQIAFTLGSIGLLYESMDKIELSLHYFQKSLSIYQQILPPSHPFRVRSEQGIFRMKAKAESSGIVPEYVS